MNRRHIGAAGGRAQGRSDLTCRRQPVGETPVNKGAYAHRASARIAASLAALTSLAACSDEQPATPVDQIFAELCRDVGLLDGMTFQPQFEDGQPIETVARVTYGSFGGGTLQLDRSSYPHAPIELIDWKEGDRSAYAIFDSSCGGDCVAAIKMTPRRLDLGAASWRTMGGFESTAQCSPLWSQGYIVFDILEMGYAGPTSSIPERAADDPPGEIGAWLLQAFDQALPSLVR